MLFTFSLKESYEIERSMLVFPHGYFKAKLKVSSVRVPGFWGVYRAKGPNFREGTVVRWFLKL